MRYGCYTYPSKPIGLFFLVNHSHHPFTACLNGLQLSEAHALLSTQGGARLPDAESDPIAYLQALVDGLCNMSLRDPLTGIANRRDLMAALEGELDRVARSGDAALLLMVDVDHFKNVNDQHGHNIGDQALQHVAKLLQQCVRPMDTLARYGGEEFAIVLPACQPAYGKSVADRIRQTVEHSPVVLAPDQHLQLTVSIGGAYALQWIRSTNELWIERADQQLYYAKNQGRNCVCIEPQPDSTVTAEEKNLLFDGLIAPCYAYCEPEAASAAARQVTSRESVTRDE